MPYNYIKLIHLGVDKSEIEIESGKKMAILEFLAQNNRVVFMNKIETFVSEEDEQSVKTLIRNGVREYNFPYLGAWETKPFTIYIKDENGTVIAGTYGRYIPSELIDIDYFWVDNKHRHQKLGTKLMAAVENFAKQYDIPRIDLYTMEFQAMGFYEKQGFVLLATVPKWARKYDAHFMRKILSKPHVND